MRAGGVATLHQRRASSRIISDVRRWGMQSGRAPGAAVRRVYLIGFMGAGKSSVGRALARRIGWAFVDLDRAIERRAGKSVARVFRDLGEPGFRSLERRAFWKAAGRSRVIIACGGGAVESGAIRRRLAREHTVLLQAPLFVFARRLGARALLLPLLSQDRPH